LFEHTVRYDNLKPLGVNATVQMSESYCSVNIPPVATGEGEMESQSLFESRKEKRSSHYVSPARSNV
jgi:hypothetical protein